ncbi:MAG: hypothetical protein OEV36_13010, partial [Myxococcales bacterium]|nr:hypothetical protein [Myxococcales bacterium]
FVAGSKGLERVWRLEIDPRTLDVTGGPHQVTSLTEDTRRLRLSKDGRRLAFDAAQYWSARLYSYALDASGRQITSTPLRLTPEGMSAWGPDLTQNGTVLAFQGTYPGNPKPLLELRVANLSDGSQRVLISSDVGGGEFRFPLRWSPDGTRLTYRRQLGSMFSIQILDVRTRNEQALTSPVASSSRETPYGWSIDGDFVIVSSLRYNPARATIVLVPVSQAPKAEQRATKITDSAEFNLWNASMSPDGKWVCLQATRPGPQAATHATGAEVSGPMSKLAVVSARGGPWIEITDGTFWDDKPRWSADGRLLYFFSDRGGLFNVWAIAFDSTKGERTGDPFPVTTFTGVGEQAPVHFGTLDLGLGGGRLAIPVINPTGGIWMLDNLKR